MKSPDQLIRNLTTLIKMASEPVTVRKLSEALHCTTRNVFRHIIHLEEIGFRFHKTKVSKTTKFNITAVPPQFMKDSAELTRILMDKSLENGSIDTQS